MKINFDEVMIFTDLEKKAGEITSIRKDFANFIYTQGQGIAAHALALKIYNGNVETEYNQEEVELIRVYSRQLTPCIIDAIAEMLADVPEPENKEE
jgi:hypothetical protein